ncbi:MAG: YfcE family phosphodiesterase [Lawsonibacter sp.]|nr:YfcE family phosphodiesterase [Lawsonibacter sp.]
MKILVFSDSHRSLVGMYRAIEVHCPDQVIHLGDLQRDAEEVSLAYPQLPICMVPGNCDGWTTEAPKKQITLAGTQVLLSHGHLWGVKQSYDAALADARASGADILLFGHTHRPVCQQLDDGLWMLNPGPSRTSYGLVLLERDHIQCSIRPQP